VFNVPLLFVGSDFQKQVWNALMQIPFGVTKSYMELSKQFGNEKAIRAVASANGANAISIMVPCHRIIGSNCELTGYAGGLPVKKQLLQLEGSYGQQ
jgi:methylated-DNA-[protein]-cysteine S-methyltransferase